MQVRRVWRVLPPPGQWDLPSEPEEGGLGAAPRFAERFTHACFRLCLGKSPSKPGKEVALAALCRLREVERLTHDHTAAVSSTDGRVPESIDPSLRSTRSITTDVGLSGEPRSSLPCVSQAPQT